MNRYKAIRRITRGLMSEVLIAQDTRDGGLVVVKRLLPDLALDSDLTALFEREIAIARKLEHPNIVRILDVGRSGKTPFYVMEHLEGVDLRTAINALRKQGKQMPVATGCFVGAAIARGLAFAHGWGILHRDIKPANVFLTTTGRAVILDFGIATSHEHVVLTRTGIARGTRAYMAPEQQTALALDIRVDIFALGIVLWESLTSRRLFKRETEEATARAVLHEPAPPPSAHAKGIPSRVEALIMGMLAKLPTSRPPAATIAQVLEMDARQLTRVDEATAIATLAQSPPS